MPNRDTIADLSGLEAAAGRPPILRVAERVPNDRVVDWVGERREALRYGLLRHGALLVRGLELRDPDTLSRVAAQLTASMAPEREAFARRRPLGGQVLSSLDWPPDQAMCMHHEMSYATEFPGMLLLGCFATPARGGVTGLADAAQVLAALPPALVERFSRQGWRLARSYSDLVGMPWSESFRTTDRDAAEEYGRTNAIAFAWQPGGGLRTSQHRPAVIRHPATGDPLWFNQIAFLNEWTMEPAVREYLVWQLGQEGLPFNTSHGDGEPIEPETIQTIIDAYEAATLREPWQTGDLLLVDNLRMAHSREPYQGRREIGLVFADPVRLADCDPTYRPAPPR